MGIRAFASPPGFHHLQDLALFPGFFLPLGTRLLQYRTASDRKLEGWGAGSKAKNIQSSTVQKFEV